MATQNYSNHRQFVPLFHGVLLGILALTFIGSLVNLGKSFGDHERLYSAALISVICFCVIMLFFFARVFPLKAPDRAIRAEENLRHFAMTGKRRDPLLTVRQIVALRFGSGGELVPLAKPAARAGLAPGTTVPGVPGGR